MDSDGGNESKEVDAGDSDSGNGSKDGNSNKPDPAAGNENQKRGPSGHTVETHDEDVENKDKKNERSCLSFIPLPFRTCSGSIFSNRPL